MAQASNPESGRQPHEENDTPEVGEEHAHPLQEDSEAISIEQSAEEDGEDTPETEGDGAAEADVADPVVALKAQVQEMKDQALRAMAETENVRRRAQRDVEEAGKYAVCQKVLLGKGRNLVLPLHLYHFNLRIPLPMPLHPAVALAMLHLKNPHLLDDFHDRLVFELTGGQNAG